MPSIVEPRVPSLAAALPVSTGIETRSNIRILLSPFVFWECPMCIRRNALVSRLSAPALICAPDFVQFGAQISQKGDGARPVSIGENWAPKEVDPTFIPSL